MIRALFYDLITTKRLNKLAEEANRRSESAPPLLRLRLNLFAHHALMLAWSLDHVDAESDSKELGLCVCSSCGNALYPGHYTTFHLCHKEQCMSQISEGLK